MYIRTSTKFTSSKPEYLRCVSRIQFGPELYPYNLSYEYDILYSLWQCRYQSNTRNANLDKFIISVLEGSYSLPVSKVSARHLRHVTWRELASVGHSLILEKAYFLFLHLYNYRHDPYMTEAYFVGLILWVLNLKDGTYDLVSKSSIWTRKFDTLQTFLSYIKKNITLKLKALQNTLSSDLSQAFEFEVLINRGIGDIDWEAERLHRTKPNVCNLDSNTVYKLSCEIFDKAKRTGMKPTSRSWDPFWATRWKWAPAGSYYSQHADDDKYRAHESTLRNKIFSLCAMPNRNFSHFYNRKPQLRAKAMVKYEWGKQRAIYSVDNTSFILSQFAMGDCETVLSKVFPIGPSASSEQVRDDVKELLRNGIPYCFDFEDFNSQHSTLNMQVVLSAYRDIFSTNLSEDQKLALNWQIAALDDVQILQKDGSSYTSCGTLLSGWRMTTFVNTVLNKVYIQSCLPQTDVITLHNGDDVLAAVTSLREVNLLMKNAKIFNIRFQANKCFLGAIAEFLRVDHKTGDGSQYLPRAISTYVHAPTESIIPNDLIAVLRSQQTRMIEVLSRGGNYDVMTRICAAQTRFISKIWGVTPNEIDIIRQTHVSLGGINDVITSNSLNYHIERVEVSRPFDPGGKLAEDMRRPLPGVEAYAMYLVKRFNLQPYIGQLTHSIRRSIYATTLMTRFTVIIKKVDKIADNTIVVAANQYRMYKGVADNMKTLLAKAFRIPLFEFTKQMSFIVEALRWTKEPLKTLILWT